MVKGCIFESDRDIKAVLGAMVKLQTRDSSVEAIRYLAHLPATVFRGIIFRISRHGIP
jgi:hypothetical protein